MARNSALTKIVRFADRHEKKIAIISGVWLAISIAAWIPQIPIPDVPYITGRDSWLSSAAWNVVWWSFAYPALAKRRAEMQAAGLGSEPRDN